MSIKINERKEGRESLIKALDHLGQVVYINLGFTNNV